MALIEPIPTLYVEGKDDISVVNALLRRHGLDTNRGDQYLKIQDQDNVETLLANMPEAIKAASDKRVGFVVDIDIEIMNRWQAVRNRLNEINITTPEACPTTGFFGRLPDYLHDFGVWLMPDCKTDGQILEHLIQTLVPADDPLWPHAQSSTAVAANLVAEANAKSKPGDRKWKRFADKVRIKAEVHAWLAWQRVPGASLGAAINDHILGHNSPEALAFLRWLKTLFNLNALTTL